MVDNGEPHRHQPQLVIDQMSSLPADENGVVTVPKNLTLFHGTIVAFNGFQRHSFFSTTINRPVGFICRRARLLKDDKKSYSPQVIVIRATRPLRLKSMNSVDDISQFTTDDNNGAAFDGVVSLEDEELRLNDAGLTAIETIREICFPVDRVCSHTRSLEGDAGEVQFYDNSYISRKLHHDATSRGLIIEGQSVRNHLLNYAILYRFAEVSDSARYAAFSMIRLNPAERVGGRSLNHQIIVYADDEDPLPLSLYETHPSEKLADSNRKILAVASFAHHSNNKEVILFGIGGIDSIAESYAARAVVDYAKRVNLPISALEEDMKRINPMLYEEKYALLGAVENDKANNAYARYGRCYDVPCCIKEFMISCAKFSLSSFGKLEPLIANDSDPSPAGKRLLWVNGIDWETESSMSVGFAMVSEQYDALVTIVTTLGYSTIMMVRELLAEAFHLLSNEDIIFKICDIVDHIDNDDGIWIYEAMSVFARKNRADESTATGNTFKTALLLCKGRSKNRKACSTVFEIIGHFLRMKFTKCAAALMELWTDMILRHIRSSSPQYRPEIRLTLQLIYAQAVVDSTSVPREIREECYVHLCPSMVWDTLKNCVHSKLKTTKDDNIRPSLALRFSYSDSFAAWRILQDALEHMPQANIDICNNDYSAEKLLCAMLLGADAISTPDFIRYVFASRNWSDDNADDVFNELPESHPCFDDTLFRTLVSSDECDVTDVNNNHCHADEGWIEETQRSWCLLLVNCKTLYVTYDFTSALSYSIASSVLSLLAHKTSVSPCVVMEVDDMLAELLASRPACTLKSVCTSLSNERLAEVGVIVLYVAKVRAAQNTVESSSMISRGEAEMKYNLQPYDLLTLEGIAITEANGNTLYSAAALSEYVHILYGPNRAPKRVRTGGNNRSRKRVK